MAAVALRDADLLRHQAKGSTSGAARVLIEAAVTLEKLHDAAYAALSRARSENADGWRTPKGWKLVPIEPTQDMLDMVTGDLGKRGIPTCVQDDPTMRSIYQDMLDAVPAPPVEEKKDS